jgi:hypothetical protein
MLKIHFPKELEKEYYSIRAKFGSIADDWKKYNDEIIPEDKKFAKQIIGFIINVIEYIIKNHDKIKVEEYLEFLKYYDYEFFYGPTGDDNNYLYFDEKANEEFVAEFCWELRDKKFSLAKLKKIKAKYVKAIKLFT